MVRVESQKNFGLRIADCGLIRVPNPQSEIRNPKSRAAITLTEVLISMGILTLGLLGVAALFPVGGWYMQQAVISDNGAAIGQAVMNDIVARGTVNPKAWYAFVPQSLANSTAHVMFPSDGKYVNPKPAVLQTTFTRPFAQALNEALAQPAAATDTTLVSRQFGNAFIIDPMYVAAAAQRTNAPNNTVAYAFPASAVRSFPRNGAWGYYQNAAWNPWRTGTGSSNTNERVWPIRRVTFQDASSLFAGSKGWPINASMSAQLFHGNDDLTTDLPARDDRPARQNWDTIVSGSTTAPLARQWTGDYSWIVSVVPTTIAARDGMARNPESFSYDVSVVVFYKRILPSEPAANNPGAPGLQSAFANERMVSASVYSSGLNGGELLLTEIVDHPENPFQQLKTGNWIMLCGPHPNSTNEEPRFVLNWYQVLSIETGSWQGNQRLVSVRGPEWPWKPTTPPGYGVAGLSNDLCVAICRGAVAVHKRTMRLESEYGTGMALVKP